MVEHITEHKIREKEMKLEQTTLEMATEATHAHDAKHRQLYAKDQVHHANTASTEADRKKAKEEYKKALKRANLPAASKRWGTDVEPEKDLSIIAIMSDAMGIQAKANSNYWKTLWQQGSTNMEMQLKFAPIVAESTKQAYLQQSKATKEDASKEFKTAWAMGIATGATLLYGGYKAYKAAGNESKTLAAKEVTDTTESEAPSLDEANKELEKAQEAQANAREAQREAPSEKHLKAVSKANDDVEVAQAKAEWAEAADDDPNKEILQGHYEELQRAKDPSSNESGAWKTAKWMWGKAGRLSSGVSEGMSQAMEATKLTQMPATCAQMAIANYHDTRKAVYQATEGQYHATSKMSEGYAQYYGQNYQRHEDLRQGSQQLIDYSMNIMKSSVDTITQTELSMFRG